MKLAGTLAFLNAGGPGSGRHPAYGTFEKQSGGTKATYYTAGKSNFSGGGPRHIVIVNNPSRPNGKTTVTERDTESFNLHGSPSKESQVFQTYRNGGASQNNDFHDFMKQRYGIEHKD